MKFVPERFDPESEFFPPPHTEGKRQRSKYSYNPFSTHMRRCPGKNFAMLELKVIIAEFLRKFEYELEPTLTQNPYVRFSLRSQFK